MVTKSSDATTTQPRRPLSKKNQIREYISGLLETGQYQSGQMLPTLRELAKEFNTSVTPVIQAMREFESEGLVEIVQGQGCRIRSVARQEGRVVARPVIDVIGISEDLDPKNRPHTVAGLQLGILRRLGSTLDIKTTVIAIAPHDRKALDATLREIALQRPNGMTMGPVGELTDSHQFARLRQIQSSGTKVVLFASGHDFAEFDVVESDFAMGQRLLTEHLLGKGHKELLRLGFLQERYYERRKQEGFRQALENAGMDPAKADEWTIEFHEPPGGENYLRQRLEYTIGLLAIALAKRPVTAIMAGNDARVPEVRKALTILGKTDIEVTGYDGFWNELHGELVKTFGEEAATGAPVSVDTNLVECGSSLAELLIARVRGELPLEPQRIVIPQSLILPSGP